MHRLELAILKNLLYDESYSRKTLPFLKAEYFQDRAERILFEEIHQFITAYNSPPSFETLVITLNDSVIYREDEVQKATATLSEIQQGKAEVSDPSWLIDQTERFCQDKAVYNAVLESVAILEGKDKHQSKGSIPELLTKALGVSFDSSVGHDYTEDYDARFDFYHQKETRIPFDLDFFNKVTNGGLPNKTLNIALAGCVHPETTVILKNTNGQEESVAICTLGRLLELHPVVEVKSVDGWVPATGFVDKGRWEEYVLELVSGQTVRCNENHLFETSWGWVAAKELVAHRNLNYLTQTGYVRGSVHTTGQTIPIVDIMIGHPKHRYFTNGVSSHNTGVGKSLFMCHMAAAALSQGKNVLYITLEMAEERIAERIDANLLGVDLKNLVNLSREEYQRRFGALKSKTSGKLIIKEYPTANAGSMHFRNLLNELLLKRSFAPDILFIDYLNICTSSRIKIGSNVNSYTYIKSIAEELRGLAVEFNIPIISATQTTRSGFSNTDLDLTDTSESFGLPSTADFMFALITTEELQALNQMMVKILKNRYADVNANKRFIIGVDRAKMRLYDAEQSAQTLADSGQEDTKTSWRGAPSRKNFSGLTV